MIYFNLEFSLWIEIMKEFYYELPECSTGDEFGEIYNCLYWMKHGN
jgi:hypothetical protein